MTGWLIDTDVLSAFAPGKPTLAPEIATWFRERADVLFLQTITVMEIETGIARLSRIGARERAAGFRAWLDNILQEYAERILAFDLAAARIAGALNDAAKTAGRHPGFADLAIAAIAQSRRLTVLSVNLRHFRPLGVEAFNPLA